MESPAEAGVGATSEIAPRPRFGYGSKIGAVPLPLFVVLALIVYLASITGTLPKDMVGGFATVLVLGILLGHLGMNIPILKDIGGPAILSIFVPSVMVYYHLLNADLIKCITSLMKDANFLYFYICALVSGSILGMNRVVLIQGFLRMFVPLVTGTLAAVCVGMLAGLVFGYDLHRSFFYVIMPIFAGGVGEGILPLSIGYSGVLDAPQSTLIPQLIPAAMLGNVVAIICGGLLKKLGERRPEFSGQGLLVKTGHDAALIAAMNTERPVEFPLMGAGMLIACCFFLFGSLVSLVVGIPGAVLMILSAAIVKFLRLIPERMELGTYQYYRFIAANLTWPLLVGIGVVLTPWDAVVAAVSPAYIGICVSTVLAIVTTGFFVGKLLNMYPVEAALVTACHSGLGGTGDVAILSAASRMELMPFAQISTRLGGASTVIIAVVLLRIFH
jgi:malate:Na+ symporter